MLSTSFRVKQASSKNSFFLNIKYSKKLLLTFFCLMLSSLIFIPSFGLRSSANNSVFQTQIDTQNYISSLASTPCSDINFSGAGFSTRIFPFQTAAGDIDGDGKVDLASANTFDNTISVLKNISVTGFPSFASQVTFAAGTQPSSLVIQDLDGDGKADIAVTNFVSNTVSVFRNTSTNGVINSSSFATKVDFSTGSSPSALIAKDLDGDGKPDLAFSNFADGTLSVLRNTSTSGVINSSSFAARVDFVVAAPPPFVSIANISPQALVAADLDNDGKKELVFSNPFINAISILKNTSTSGVINSSSFAAQVDFLTGNFPQNVVVGDIDADGKPDLATCNLDNTVSILRNTTSGSTINTNSFATKVDVPTGSGPFSVAIADIDGDNKLDLATSNNDGTISVLRNTSTSGVINSSSFATKVDFSTGQAPRSLIAVNIDGDNKSDLVFADLQTSSVIVLRNASTVGSFVFDNVRLDISIGTAPFFLTAGDLNSDGKPDLITANSLSATITIIKNTSSNSLISFASPMNVSVGTGPRSAAVGDIDGDGKPDIVVGNSNNNTGGASTISVLRNTGTGSTISFASQVTFTVGANPSSVAIGDIDGDGKLDVVVANANIQSSNPIQTISVLRNTSTSGNISFDNQLTFSVGSKPGTVALGDLDGDGKLDVVVANSDSISNVNVNPDTISVLRNTSTIGAISFDNQLTFPIGNVPNGLAIGDIDGDGKLDVVAGSTNTNNTSVFRNTSTVGSISFATRIDLDTGSGLKDPKLADFDGDGKLDIAVTRSNEAIVSIFKNTSSSGSISFAPKLSFPTGNNPFSVVAVDLNNDGKFDLATPNLTENTVSVLKALCPPVLGGDHNTLYVADTLNNRIQRSTNNGMSWQTVGNGAGTGLGQFNAPKGVTTNSTDTIIFVADTANNRIQRSTNGGSTWTAIATAGTAVNQVNQPASLAYDEANDKLYVADTLNNRILVASSASTTSPVFAIFAGATVGTAVGKVNQPQSVAVNQTGMVVYVADTLNNRIQMNSTGLSTGWTVLASAGSAVGQFNAPKGVYTDNSGNIWVADTSNNRIQVNISGVWSVFMSAGTAIGSVNRPESMVVNLSGNLFVADTGNNRIQSKPTAGGSATVVGQAGLNLGQFNQPSGIR